ncbi:MAG: FtsW/RodA/SpoVE family cell cycle protein [Massiliimalia sp.]|jgi:rod shape determining protein RodA
MGERLGIIREYVKTTDKLMLAICIVISSFSCILMCSVYYAGFTNGNKRIIIMQGLCAVLGLIGAIIVSLLDYQVIVKLWPFFTGAAVLLMLLLFTPLAYTPEGSDDAAWLRIGFFSFQPSEVLKMAFIYTFSLHLSRVKEKINIFSTFLLLCVHGAIPTLFVMITGDYGSALVFFAIFVVMIFTAGLSWKYMAIGVAGLGIATPIVWNMLPDYLKERFYVAWDPAKDMLDKGYQQYKGQIALGSGELFGRGLFPDENLYYVPECYNDFIFSYIGQTLGFVGCVVTILLLTVLLVKILFTAKKSKDDLGTYICVGVFAVILFQAVINIGMVLCVIPIIGITLPFVSYGGTSLVVSYVSIGMVLGVYRHNYHEMMFD